MSASDPTESSAGAEAPWRLLLCGQPRAVAAADRQQVLLEWRDAALLALLAIEGPMPRSRILSLLWPDMAIEQVRGRLRQRLYVLKSKLGVEATSGSQTLALSPQLHWPGFAQEADGALLGEDEHADLPEFAAWLQASRNRLQTQRRERLAGDASTLEAEGRLAEAIVTAEWLLALEPLQEHAHRRLMRLHYLRGDRAAALLAFDRCERVLKDEVGARPSHETLDLLAQIERAQPVIPGAGKLVRRVVPASVLRPPRLVGRDAEWAQLQTAWERGDAIVVIGEAGMGKTRLVGDLVHTQAAKPGAALQVSARPGDERVPYAMLSRLLRAILGTIRGALPAGVEAELARLLPELPQHEQATSASDAAAQARFVGAIEATLQVAVAAGLQAVVLDDLHFADAASLEMAQHLTANAQIRWIAAFRAAEIDAPARALVDTLTGARHAEPVLLQALTVEQVAELVDSLNVEGLAASALAAALHQRSGGNPLFLLETLKALLMGTRADTSPSDARALAQLPAAGNVRRLIERRIGQLSREAVQLARCAAIAGQDFTAALAARVLQTTSLGLSDPWVELEEAQILRNGGFAHDLIFEAARASVPKAIASDLHRIIAEYLDEQGAEPARIAAHWLAAANDEKACVMLEQAGHAACKTMRLHEGLDFYDQAQQIYSRTGRRQDQCRVINASSSLALTVGSLSLLDRWVEQGLEAAVTDTERSAALCSKAELYCARLLAEDAVDFARSALALSQQAQDKPAEHNARLVLANSLSQSGRAAEAELVLRAGAEWADSQPSDDLRLNHALALAFALQHGDQPARAVDAWDRATTMARQAGSGEALPSCLMNLGASLFTCGRLTEARARMEQGLQLIDTAANPSPYARAALLRLAVMDRPLGLYTEALHRVQRVFDAKDVADEERSEASLEAMRCLLDLGQNARALEHAAPLLSGARPAETDMHWSEALADLCAAAGRVDAPVWIERGLAQARHVIAARTERMRRPSLLGAWRIQLRFGNEDVALTAAAQSIEYAQSRGLHGQLVTLQALAAQRCARAGLWPRAAQLAIQTWYLSRSVPPSLLYPGRIWLALDEAWGETNPQERHHMRQSAIAWLYRAAADSVPPAFRESFLHRNRINVEILRWAQADA